KDKVKQIAGAKDSYKKLQRKIVKVSADIKHLEKIERVQSQLNDLTKPKEIATPDRNVKYTDSNLLLFKEVGRYINILEPLIDDLIEHKETDVKKEIKAVKKKINKMNSIRQDDEYQTLLTQKNEYKFKSKLRKKLSKQA